jgi:hypothetical protein
MKFNQHPQLIHKTVLISSPCVNNLSDVENYKQNYFMRKRRVETNDTHGDVSHSPKNVSRKFPDAVDNLTTKALKFQSHRVLYLLVLHITNPVLVIGHYIDVRVFSFAARRETIFVFEHF